ncbi:uncharacterized protein LOC101206784 [Cucumis sativus]|uniref:Uncharacterized protein n=1 Tax=Cucumis sativus TaxID=3659 RepID=A0A0A0L3E6_CUCSA|nr:uncharacterized protein LOC101206784 [Cucumis sativus]KGN55524.1 hypothetical protein Csa_012730 [Cucumis sativus]
MAAISNSLVLTKSPQLQLTHGSNLKTVDRRLGSLSPTSLVLSPGWVGNAKLSTSRRSLSVQAAYRDDGRSSTGIFIGGFVLGGLIVGTLGCVYAPQISKVIAGTDRKELMKKLPKFIYDEEKALEKTRKMLALKIEQLNSAIDEVAAEYRSESPTNGLAMDSDEVESII